MQNSAETDDDPSDVVVDERELVEMLASLRRIEELVRRTRLTDAKENERFAASFESEVAHVYYQIAWKWLPEAVRKEIEES